MTKRENTPLRDQIIAFLKSCDEATLKQIAAATTERDFPSRVTTELNKMRTDALVECAKKNGKNEMWYWLATSQADQSGTSRPAVTHNTGSSASVSASATPAEGAAVQPQPAPAAPAEVSTAGPAAEDDTPALSVLAAAENAMLRSELAKADADLQQIHALLAHRVSGPIDPNDLGEVECAEKAAEMIDEAVDEISKALTAVREKDDELLAQARVVVDLRAQLGEERTARQALQEQIDELQRDAMRGASLLSGGDRYTAACYLVRAPKRPMRIFNKAEAAQAAAMAAARNGSGRGEVFALVPTGRAVRGAEWRAA